MNHAANEPRAGLDQMGDPVKYKPMRESANRSVNITQISNIPGYEAGMPPIATIVRASNETSRSSDETEGVGEGHSSEIVHMPSHFTPTIYYYT